MQSIDLIMKVSKWDVFWTTQEFGRMSETDYDDLINAHRSLIGSACNGPDGGYWRNNHLLAPKAKAAGSTSWFSKEQLVIIDADAKRDFSWSDQARLVNDDRRPSLVECIKRARHHMKGGKKEDKEEKSDKVTKDEEEEGDQEQAQRKSAWFQSKPKTDLAS
jgi:hypothetical protein